ncbi:MAG TPA: hypothetical protein PK358_09905 [Spirochaetota bacterium]|nr:hypothetical protein [Spirochaetota bacterium]HPJ35137.1 hypothetical protein [Spirochaetota bacterium]
MGKEKENACMPELTDEMDLCNELYSKCCNDELREIDRHEIIVRICQFMGASPENLTLAEKIFDVIKYDITRYVLHHEYCPETRNQVKPKFLLWLDGKAEPKKAEQLSNFLDKYLK